MRVKGILQRRFRRARELMSSRDAAEARAARRALGALAIVQRGWDERGELRPYIEALMRATVILDALEHRDRRAADRRRALQLARSRPAPVAKVSDAEIAAALDAMNGNARRAAEVLNVNPSTVSRRRVALRAVTGRNDVVALSSRARAARKF